MVVWCVALVLALSWGGSTYAWSSPEVLGLFALVLVGQAPFYLIEQRSAAPLFDMSWRRIPTFTWTGFVSLCFGAAFLGSVLFIPFYLVMAKNISPLSSGLNLTPLVGGVVVDSVSGGLLAQRLGRVKVLLLSTLLLYLWLLGIGIGPGFSLYVLAVQNVVPLRQMGVASSGNMFFRQVGSAVGAAFMGVVLASTLSTQIPAHLPKTWRRRRPSSRPAPIPSPTRVRPVRPSCRSSIRQRAMPPVRSRAAAPRTGPWPIRRASPSSSWRSCLPEAFPPRCMPTGPGGLGWCGRPSPAMLARRQPSPTPRSRCPLRRWRHILPPAPRHALPRWPRFSTDSRPPNPASFGGHKPRRFPRRGMRPATARPMRWCAPSRCRSRRPSRTCWGWRRCWPPPRCYSGS